MFCYRFLRNLNEIFHHWFRLASCCFDLPCILDLSGPNIFSAILKSSVLIGQLLMIFIGSGGSDLKLSIIGVPTMWYSFLASFASSNWRVAVLYPFLLLVTVLIKLLVPALYYSTCISYLCQLCTTWLACLSGSPCIPHIGITLRATFELNDLNPLNEW